MGESPLASLSAYSRLVAECVNRPSVTRSTLAVWSDSPFTGIAEGEVYFASGIRLRMREELDFDAGVIASYATKSIAGRSGCSGMTTFRIRRTPRLLRLFRITSICRRTSAETEYPRRT